MSTRKSQALSFSCHFQMPTLMQHKHGCCQHGIYAYQRHTQCDSHCDLTLGAQAIIHESRPVGSAHECDKILERLLFYAFYLRNKEKHTQLTTHSSFETEQRENFIY